MLLPGRHGSEHNANDYRYSFQGQEHDDEVKGKGNSVNFGARFHDPRIGRWFSRDREIKAELSPYQFAKNNGIIYLDPDGNDELWFVIRTSTVDGKVQHSVTLEYIETSSDDLKIRVVTNDAAGIDPNQILQNLDLFPGVVEIKPYHKGTFIPNQGSRIADRKNLPLGSDYRVGQALDDYAYLGKLVAIVGSDEVGDFLIMMNAPQGSAEAITGSSSMDASMTVTEYAGYAEGVVGVVTIGRKFIQSLVQESTEALADLAVKRATVNYTSQQLGQMGEDAVRAVYGGAKETFKTSQGIRYVDILADGVAYEAKVGYKTASAFHKKQLAKDLELLADPNSGVDEVVWTFFRSPQTGKVGASQGLLDLFTAAQEQGFNIRTQILELTDEIIENVVNQ